MLLLSPFPRLIGFLGSVPSAVIGGMMIYIMASQVSAGLQIVIQDLRESGFSFENLAFVEASYESPTIKSNELEKLIASEFIKYNLSLAFRNPKRFISKFGSIIIKNPKNSIKLIKNLFVKSLVDKKDKNKSLKTP